MMARRAIAILLGLASCVALAQPAPAPPPESSPASSGAIAAAPAEQPPGRLDADGVEAFVDGWMAAYLDENGAVGGVVSIVENGRIVLAKGYGEDDLERRREVDARRTLFRAGSVSKLFVWTAVMQLAEQGKVDLEADVNRYLKGLAVPATFKDPVTLAHLMSHTAGFEDHVLGLFAREASGVRPLSELLAAQLPTRVRPPGVVASYSNHGTALAMLVVEQVSGMPWMEYVETRILDPLGMKRTTFAQPVESPLREDVSIGYRVLGGEPEAQDFEYVPLAPAGALSTTATDIARFMLAHLDHGRLGDARILSEPAARRMHRTLHRHDPAVPGMAYGFIEGDRNGRRIVGHGGDTLWFHTELELYLDQGVGIFASFNTEGAEPAKLTEAFADRYFPAAEWAPQLAAGEWSKVAERFVGSYRSVRYSHDDLTKLGALVSVIDVSDAGNGALRLSSSPDARFVQIEPLVFREQRGTSTIAFREARRGRITHLFMGDVPVFAFERVPWYESQQLHAAIAVVGLLLSLGTVIAAPAGALLRRRLRAPATKPQSRLPLAARVVLWAASFVLVVFWLGLVYQMRDPNQVVFGLEPALRYLLLLPYLAGAFALAALLCGVWIWRKKRGSLMARLGYMLVVAALFLSLWQIFVWRLFGHAG
jgi:CubicO group peptidase (beta-lactamase class C family)